MDILNIPSLKNKVRFLCLIPLFSHLSTSVCRGEELYVVNEGWFGHETGSVNLIDLEGDKIQYRLYFSSENGVSLGETTQYGVMYDGWLYLVSKGSSHDAGVLVRVNTDTDETEVVVNDFEEEGVQAAAYCPVNCDKGFLSSDKGLYVVDVVERQCVLVDTPFDTESRPQFGDMVCACDYLFAVARGRGVVVVDCSSFEVVATFDFPEISSVFLGADGFVYAAIDNPNMEFVRINPSTIGLFQINAGGVKDVAIANSWDSWRSGYVATTDDNVLYYVSKSGGINTFDLESFELAENAIDIPDALKIYGGLRCSPDSNRLYVSVVDEMWGNYVLVYSLQTGNLIKKYSLDYATFWFPALLVCRDVMPPNMRRPDDIKLAFNPSIAPYKKELCLEVEDSDSPTCGIVGFVEAENDGIVEITEKGHCRFVIQAKAVGATNLIVGATSQGREVSASVAVEVLSTNGIDNATESQTYYTIYDMNGLQVSNKSKTEDLAPGVYVKKFGNGLTEKLLIPYGK